MGIKRSPRKSVHIILPMSRIKLSGCSWLLFLCLCSRTCRLKLHLMRAVTLRYSFSNDSSVYCEQSRWKHKRFVSSSEITSFPALMQGFLNSSNADCKIPVLLVHGTQFSWKLFVRKTRPVIVHTSMLSIDSVWQFCGSSSLHTCTSPHFLHPATSAVILSQSCGFAQQHPSGSTNGCRRVRHAFTLNTSTLQFRGFDLCFM